MPAGQPTTESIEAMKAAQPYFQEAWEDIARSLDNMETNIAALKASWSGETAAIYQGALDTWVTNGKTVERLLGTVNGALQAHIGNVTNTNQVTGDAALQVQKTMASPLPGF